MILSGTNLICPRQFFFSCRRTRQLTYFGDFVGVFRIQTYYCYGRSLKFLGPFSYFSDQSSNIQERAKISSLGWMPSDFENILEISLKSTNAKLIIHQITPCLFTIYFPTKLTKFYTIKSRYSHLSNKLTTLQMFSS